MRDHDWFLLILQAAAAALVIVLVLMVLYELLGGPAGPWE